MYLVKRNWWNYSIDENYMTVLISKSYGLVKFELVEFIFYVHMYATWHTWYSNLKFHRDVTEIQQLSEGEPTKAQLMEALCHSQTRAREAEKAAKQAYAEKEHIFKLFFRQATQLFAYKQWFQLLQLETLCIQIKNNDQPGSAVVPVVLPWMPFKGRKLRRNWRKGPKGKRGRRAEPRHDITKYAVAFALGFSLVGAGLLLGWTVGWMLPHL